MKTLLCCSLALALALEGFCQDINPPIDARTNIQGFPASRREPPSLKALTIDQQKLWQARVTVNAKAAKAILGDTALVTSYTGATDGKQLIGQIETGACKVNSFKLTDFVLESSHPTVVEFAYRAFQDAKCNDRHLPQTVQVKVGYIDTGRNWTVAYYHEEIPKGSAEPNKRIQ